MAVSTLTSLPTELLEEIIRDAVPEGFESLALTCKTIHELCTPLIERHNHLRGEFQIFRYQQHSRDPLLSPIRTSIDLIKRIAIEPVVARYITHADLGRDGWPDRDIEPQLLPDVHLGGPVATLIADSPHLRQAGLGWKEYYTQIKSDQNHSSDYSEHAAAFILTLLPNVKSLRLPLLWRPDQEIQKLCNVILRNTKQPRFPWDKPSLAQVTRFQSERWFGTDYKSDLDDKVPFLALPRVQSFRAANCIAVDTPSPFIFKDRYPQCSDTLESAYLEGCWIGTISAFLEHTPRLKILKYRHLTRRGGYSFWNICKFATEIGRGAGSHLEELSISIIQHPGSMPPGRASMSDFKCLRKLELPLEVAMCNFADAASRATALNENLTDQELEEPEPFISDLVPASVSELSLLSSRADYHEEGLEALKVMFRDFADKKDAQLPALKEIHISPPNKVGVDDEYKEECTKLAAETSKVGVMLHLQTSEMSITTPWTWGPNPKSSSVELEIRDIRR